MQTRFDMPDGSVAEIRHLPDPAKRRWPNSSWEWEIWYIDTDGEEYCSANAASYDDARANAENVLAAACRPAPKG